ncbi:hypothetical protein HDU83_008049 [Entophlyctis luteolus]|nr:hypothetical protein HDU83_008049 [Entophlyctis luteolus]
MSEFALHLGDAATKDYRDQTQRVIPDRLRDCWNALTSDEQSRIRRLASTSSTITVSVSSQSQIQSQSLSQSTRSASQSSNAVPSVSHPRTKRSTKRSTLKAGTSYSVKRRLSQVAAAKTTNTTTTTTVALSTATAVPQIDGNGSNATPAVHIRQVQTGKTSQKSFRDIKSTYSTHRFRQSLKFPRISNDSRTSSVSSTKTHSKFATDVAFSSDFFTANANDVFDNAGDKDIPDFRRLRKIAHRNELLYDDSSRIVSTKQSKSYFRMDDFDVPDDDDGVVPEL